jgi:hypothetical protein
MARCDVKCEDNCGRLTGRARKKNSSWKDLHAQIHPKLDFMACCHHLTKLYKAEITPQSFEEALMYMCPTKYWTRPIICKMQKPCDGRWCQIKNQRNCIQPHNRNGCGFTLPCK